MGRLDHILVGVDASDSGFHALDQAIHLAEWSKCRVTVLTVVPFYEGDLSLVGVKNPKSVMAGPGRDTLIRALDMADARHFPVEVLCESGDPAEKVLFHARSLQADWVVVGAGKTRPPLSAAMFGALGRMMRWSHRHLFIVPEGTQVAWEHVLVVLSGRETTTDAVTQALEWLARFGGKTLTVSVPEGLSDHLLHRMYNEARVRECLDALRKSYLHGIGPEDCRLTRRHRLKDAATFPPRPPSMVILSQPAASRFHRSIHSWPVERWVRSSPCPVMQLPPGPLP